MNSKLLLLDIDRTLVHSILTHLVKQEWLPLFKWIIYEEYTVFFRPHIDTFLNYLKNESEKNTHFKIGIFTAGSKEYANFINKHLLSELNINQEYIFSSKEYDECFDFDGIRKSIRYINHITSIPIGNIYLIEDSTSIKNGLKELKDQCYNISKFVVCYDFTYNFVENSISNNGLIDCIEWIQNIK